MQFRELTLTKASKTFDLMPASTKSKFVAKPKQLARAVVGPRKIDAKQAVSNAIGYFQDFFPLHAKSNMLLEELEESGDGKRWFVTLGYDTQQRQPRINLLDSGGPVREYKIFSIDGVTGKIVSVKIRKI